MPRAFADLTATELAMFRRRLDTPSKIQQFLDGITYNLESCGDTFRSPRRVLRDRTANCIEGAVLAAAALLSIPAELDLWPPAAHLKRIPHLALLPPAVGRQLTRLDGRLKAAGLLHHPTAGPDRATRTPPRARRRG